MFEERKIKVCGNKLLIGVWVNIYLFHRENQKEKQHNYISQHPVACTSKTIQTKSSPDKTSKIPKSPDVLIQCFLTNGSLLKMLIIHLGKYENNMLVLKTF